MWLHYEYIQIGILRLFIFSDAVFVDGSSYSCCYGDKGVHLPFFIILIFW